MGGWEFGSLGVWEFGRLGVWEFGRLGGWEVGSLGGWEVPIVDVNFNVEDKNKKSLDHVMFSSTMFSNLYQFHSDISHNTALIPHIYILRLEGRFKLSS
jgi:hypothetical protein